MTLIQPPKHASRLLAVGTRLDSLFSSVTPSPASSSAKRRNQPPRFPVFRVCCWLARVPQAIPSPASRSKVDPSCWAFSLGCSAATLRGAGEGAARGSTEQASGKERAGKPNLGLSEEEQQ